MSYYDTIAANASISNPSLFHMDPNKLQVVTAVFNPIRWKTRWHHYSAFEAQMLDAGVQLTTVECQLGEREFVLDNPRVNHVKVRSYTVVFNKENLLRLAIQRIPEWKYLVWSDCDILFRHPDWASEALHALQQYNIIQPWSDVYLTGPAGLHSHVAHFRSFCRVWWEGGQVIPGGPNFWDKDGGYHLYPHTGFCWGIRRQAYEDVGGLLETAVVGSGDNHMALSLVGGGARSVPQQMSEGYKRPIMTWQDRALLHINKNIGFTWGTIEHMWHGSVKDRQYWDRWKIFIDNKFDPDFDLKKNSYGVIELAGNKPQLTRDIDVYMHKRNEDANFI